MVVVEYIGDLIAVGRLVEAANCRYDESADDHDDTDSNNGAGIEPGSEHPSAVLVDLEAFDVDVGEYGTSGG